MNSIFTRSRALMAVGLLGSAALLSLPAPAAAHGGFFFGVAPVPLVVPPPVVYPPYYAPYYPPTYYYAPPPPPAQSKPAPQKGSQQAVTYGSLCRAGVYSCAVAPYTPLGSVCSCPGIGAPSYGQTY